MKLANSPFPSVSIGTLAHPEPGSFKIGPFGSSLKKDELVEQGIAVLGIENVLPNRLIPAFRKFITKEKFDQLSQYEVKVGDVLVTTMGTIGRAAVVPDGIGSAIIDSHLFRMRLDQTKVYPSYLCYALNGYDSLQREIKGMASGAIMAGLNTTILKACSIPLPPLPEQHRIVAILNEQMAAVEKARAAAEEQLATINKVPAAYLRSVFNSPDAQQWPKTRLGEMALLIQNGIYKSAENYGRGHPFLRMYNIPNDSWNLNLDVLAQVVVNPREIQTFGLKTGDLLVSRVNSFELVGKCAWVGPDADRYVFENMLIRVRLNDSADSRFVAQQMSSLVVREQIERVAKRAIGQASINSEDLRGIEIASPPLVEQKRIAAILAEQMATGRAVLKTLEEQLAAINQLPAALLRRAFSGEL